MSFDARSLARPWLLDAAAYVGERELYGQDGLTLLDMNENPNGGNGGLNRYPGPEVRALYARMARLYDRPEDNLMISPGSDEAIGMLIRAFCAPGEHSIVINPPTFGMYALSAKVNGVASVAVPMLERGRIDWDALNAAADGNANARLIFLCTPQNPCGTAVPRDQIIAFARRQAGRIVVVDEAYQEFANQESLIAETGLPNLVVLRTLSKAYALAGARIGCLISSAEIVKIVKALQGPYALPTPSVKAALEALSPAGMAQSARQIAELKAERDRLSAALSQHDDVLEVFDSQANFLFIIMDKAEVWHQELLKTYGILLRNQTKALAGGLRISVGTPEENDGLLQALGLAPAPKPDRKAELKRETKETSIYCAVNLDKPGPSRCETGVGFFDHMLDQLTKHSGIAMIIKTEGDTHIDTHHTVEDTMIALGQVLDQAVGDKRGILRYGHFDLVMDEARATAAIDLSGRAHASFEGSFKADALGGLQTEMVAHCIQSLAEKLRATIHVTVTGDNDHHKCEAVFKALARALKMAVRVEGDALPSTKGLL